MKMRPSVAATVTITELSVHSGKSLCRNTCSQARMSNARGHGETGWADTSGRDLSEVASDSRNGKMNTTAKRVRTMYVTIRRILCMSALLSQHEPLAAGEHQDDD